MKSLLHLPELFWSSYEAVLKNTCLFDACLEETSGGIHGGKGKAKSDEHFAQRCSNSCSRTVYIMKSKDEELSDLPQSLWASFSSDVIGLIDLAAGSGGGTHGILTSIYEARYSYELPCIPITIHLFAADYSEESLGHYKLMVDDLRPKLEGVAVEVVYHQHVWDAADVAQTSSLCEAIKKVEGVKEYVIAVSALSGIKKSGLDALERSFQHIHESFANHCVTSVWIEPGGSGAKFLKKVVKNIYAACPWLKSNEDSANMGGKYRWYHKLQNKELPGELSCVKYSRKNLI